jgi:hypothetical protein
MDMEKAKEISRLIAEVERYSNRMENLNRGYLDDFEIWYKGSKVLDLDSESLLMLIGFYNTKKEKAEEELKKL